MNHEIKNDDDIIEIYPPEWLVKDYENGVAIEEVKRKVNAYSEFDQSEKKLAIYIVEQFYEKWGKK